jgi:AcrR family transcriptional regulator
MPAVRSTASRRRSAAVAAGLRAFAELGATTAAVQRVSAEVGVSPPYLFRLFGGTQGFFLCCLEELAERVRSVFAQAARSHPDEALSAMGQSFRELLADGVVAGLWLRASVLARSNDEVAHRCRTVLADALAEAGRLTGASPEELERFLARGAAVILLQALDVDLSGGFRQAIGRLRTETAGS